MTEASVLAALRGVIAEAGLGDRVAIEPIEPVSEAWVPPSETLRDERLLNAARTAWRGVVGEVPAPSVMSGGSDSLWLETAGIPAMSAFCGGWGSVCHRPNEAFPADDLPRSVDLVEALVRSYFAGP
jgi:acetylornithine deacetylase/succinyl-diaminopimelate desuccinylase-like protein